MVSIIAFILAGSASLLAYNYLRAQEKRPRGVGVVTAATDIAIGAKVDPRQLKMSIWPKEALPPGYHTDPQRLAGRIAVRQLTAGDVITESKLMPQNATSMGGVMAYIVPEGHRAVTVSVNEVAGVAGFITPNSRVDVVVTTAKPGADKRDDNISKIILQNIPVLACGQVTEQKEGKPTVVPTVTLDLVPDDAEKLIVGSRNGSLQLLLRNVIDVATVDTRGSTIQKALGTANVVPVAPRAPTRARPAPKAAPVRYVAPKPETCTVEIIKGGTKSTREFAEHSL